MNDTIASASESLIAQADFVAEASARGLRELFVMEGVIKEYMPDLDFQQEAVPFLVTLQQQPNSVVEVAW